MSLSRLLGLCLVTLAAFSLTALAESPEGGGSNKYRIKFNGKTKLDGELVFLFTAVEGAPQEVRIPLSKGTSENDVAKKAVKVFKEALDTKTYHFERDDWEDVLVKKKMGKDNFRLEYTSAPLKGLSVKIKKE